MKTQKKAYLYAFAAIACWSTIGSAFKLSLRYLNPAELLAVSSLVAVAVLFVILSLQGKLQALREVTSRETIFSAFLGLLNPFLYYTVLLVAYDRLKAQEAGTLNYIWPLALVLLSIPMLGQRISLPSILAILVSFAGIVAISWHPETIAGHKGRQGADPVGVVLAIGSAVVWALYWIYNLKDRRDAVGKLFLNFCFGSLYSILYLAFTQGFRSLPWPGVMGGIYLGIFEMGITFVFWMNALKYSETTAKVSNLIYLSPFISLILIHFTVGEAILPSTVAGLALIVAGIGLQQYLRR